LIEIAANLRFGKGENGIPWLRRGWSKPEEGYVWSVGPQSTVTVPLVPAAGRVLLELTLQPFVHPPALPARRLDVVVNGTVLAEKTLGWRCTLRLEIPQALRGKPGLLIELRHPEMGSPADFRVGDDGRKLGFQLHKLTVLHSGPRDELPLPAGPARQEACYRFGGNETTDAMLLEGWGAPETDYVWSVGRRSTLRLNLASSGPARTMLLDVQPFIQPPEVPRQRIAIGVDDQLLGFVAAEARTCVAFALPRPRPGADSVVVSFDNIDAAAPREVGLYADGRPFAFMLCRLRVVAGAPKAAPSPGIRQAGLPGLLDDGTLAATVQLATGRTAAEIAAGFESLGSSYEMSLLQRRLGNEPNGLLRFSGIATPLLVEGILDGFPGLGRPDTINVQIHDDEGAAYWVTDDAYALRFQTSISSHDMDEAGVKRRLARGLPFLVRKFFEDITIAEKIFVFPRREATTQPEAEAVLAALSVWGDVTMLWVQQDALLAGGVERLGPRLLRGFVDFGGVPPAASDESWLRMMASAWLEARKEADLF
jgi:hypothetical protein